MKNFIGKVLLIILAVFATANLVDQYIKMDKESKQVSYSGTVYDKIPETRGKYHHVDYYLFVKFDNGKNRSIDVSRDTYFSYKEGERITFDLASNYFDESYGQIGWLGLFAFITFCFYAFAIFCGIVFFFMWLFD